jgi:hypothetical protein
VLGIINANTNLLIEKIPQSSGSHSVAADSRLNRNFVPQVAPASVVVRAVIPRRQERAFAAQTAAALRSISITAKTKMVMMMIMIMKLTPTNVSQL